MNAVSCKYFGKLVDSVQPKEEIAPGHSFRVGGQGEVTLVDAFGVEFVDCDLQLASGFEVIDDRQRNEHGPAP